MICKVSYGEKLDRYVRNEHVIPYRLHPNARYRRNCYYWDSWEDKWFKVEDVQYDFSTPPIPTLDHVQTRDKDGLLSWITTDLTIFDFRLERDKFNIRNENIINSKQSFAGGEIEYWFFKHDITSFNEKYQEFWKYLDPNSICKVDPNKYYFITAKEVNGVYRNVKFTIDPTQEKFKKLEEEKSTLITEPVETPKSVSEIIQEERKRRKEKYEAKSKKRRNRSNRRRK